MRKVPENRACPPLVWRVNPVNFADLDGMRQFVAMIFETGYIGNEMTQRSKRRREGGHKSCLFDWN
jgi:hypothetical protein